MNIDLKNTLLKNGISHSSVASAGQKSLNMDLKKEDKKNFDYNENKKENMRLKNKKKKNENAKACSLKKDGTAESKVERDPMKLLRLL
ncbi:MAG: hypothetical protein ACXVLQ_15615 [Bacteriovorax sp.]